MSGVSSEKWGDLTPRIVSAAVMIAVGLYCMWHGGGSFLALITVATGLMAWELVRMAAPGQKLISYGCALLSGIAVLAFSAYGPWAGLAATILLVGVVWHVAPVRKEVSAAYAGLIIVGSLTLLALRQGPGFGWLMWVICVIIATDVAGYFAGKILGGPKFWPAISPKKTWSGTVAGWLGAALVGWIYGLGSGMMGTVVILSVVLSFAGQIGDIAESALKRKAGVKDSSALIPGHGGVLDRFDGVIGAAAALCVIALITGIPVGLF